MCIELISMSLKKLLATPVEDQEIIVPYHEMTFLIKGRPDANVMQQCLFLTDEDKAKHVKLIGARLKWTVPMAMIPNLFLIQHTLVNDDVEKENARYDLMEIATMARDHGPLYLQLLNAALQVLGLADMAGEVSDEGADKVAEVAAKN